jgi:hypothetical protein
MDKIEQLYNLYLERGLITSATTLEKFRAANEQQQAALYDLGKQNSLFQSSDLAAFQSAWTGVAPQQSQENQEGQPQEEDLKKKEDMGFVEQIQGFVTGTTDLPSVDSSSDSSPSFLETISQNPWQKNFVQRLYGFDKGASKQGVVQGIGDVSATEGEGGWASHKMASAEVDGKFIAFPTIVQKKGENNLTQLSDDEALNYALQNNEYLSFNDDATAKAYAKGGYKRGTILEDLSRPDFFNNALNIITPDFIDRTEEAVVPQMNYQFGPLGFKFEESGATGDWMMATAPNGQTREFSLDPAFGLGAAATANELKTWIKDNSPINGLESLESQYTAENRKFASQEEVDAEYAKINSQADKFHNEVAAFLSEKKNTEEEMKRLDSLPIAERNSPENAAAYKALMDKQLGLQDVYQKLQQQEVELTSSATILDKAVGKHSLMRAEMGEWSSGIGNAILEGIGTEAAGLVNLFVDGFLSKYTNGMSMDEMANMVSQEGVSTGDADKDKAMSLAVANANRINQQQGNTIIRLPNAGESYKDWYNSLSQFDKEMIVDKSNDDVKKEWKKNLLPAIRQGARTVYGNDDTTVEWSRTKEQGFWGGAILGVAKSLPAMVGSNSVVGWTQRTAAMYGQTSDAVYEEMSKNPEFDNISESEKLAVVAPIGIATAVLEAYGLRNLVANKGLMNKLVIGAMGKAGKVTTAKTFGELVKNEITSMGGKAGLTLLGAGLAEGETGAAQQVAEYAIKDIYNMAKGKEMFQTPDFMSADYIKDVATAGAQEAIGGFVLGVPGAIGAAYSKKGYKSMSNVQFEAFENIANDDKIQEAYIIRLKERVATGQITVKEAKQSLNDYRNAVGLYRSVPDGLSTESKKEAMNLVKEKRDLEQQKQGKDSGLVKKIDARIEEINNELNNLENQSAPTPSSPSTGPAGNKVQVLTDEEEERRGALEEAIAKANEMMPDGVTAVSVVVGENILDMGKAQAELDALNSKVEAAAAQNNTQALTQQEEERRENLEMFLSTREEDEGNGILEKQLTDSQGNTETLSYADAQQQLNELNARAQAAQQQTQTNESVLANPQSTTTALESLSPEERTSTTFTQENGTETPVMGNESMLAKLFHQVQNIPEEDRTDWQQSVLDAVTVSLKTQLDEEALQQSALQSGTTIQPSQQTTAPIVEVDRKKTKLDGNFFKSLLPDVFYLFRAETIDEVPQELRRYAVKETDNARKKVFGLPVGKKAAKTYYTYNIKGSLANYYRNEIVSAQAKRATNIAEIMANTARSLASAFPNLKPTSFKSLEDMKTYVEAKYRGSQISTQLIGGVGGMIITDENDNPIEILINNKVAKATTLPHEVWHAILVRAFGQNEELFKEFRDSIIERLNGNFPEIVDALNEFSNTPEYQASNEQAQEWLVELGGLLTASGITADNLDAKSKSLLQGIKEVFNIIAERITGEPLFLEYATSEDILDFMVSISERMAKGQDISKFFRDADTNQAATANRASLQKGGGVLQEAAPKTSSVKDIDVKLIRTLSRAGSRVSKGLAIYTRNKQKIVEEAPELSLAYVKENAPEVFISNANLIAQYPIIRGVKAFKEIKTIEQAQEVYDIFSRQIADNLEYLMNNFRQDLREIATLWYDGANILAQNFSKKYGVTTEQAAGIIASLSPQKDWYQNVRLAEMVMMAFQDNPVMSQEMVDYQREIINIGLEDKQKKINKAKAAYKKSRSKANADKLKKLIAKYDSAVKKSDIVLQNLAGLIGTKMNDAPDYAKPYYARTYNEVNTTKDYDILSPDGKVIGVAKKKDGSNSQVAWGSYTEIGKAVAIYLDGSQENITRTLGEMHKIRNFYNNIIDPMSPDKDVTMDTHAVAAALLLPLSGNSKQVEANFGTGTSNSAPLGIKGLYYAFAEGYNLAAEETGLLPRQVQSITWEAVRGLFTDDFKRDKKKVADINQIVENYVNKKITLDESRNQITEYAGGIKTPSWAGGPLQEGTTDNVEGETVGRRSGGTKSDTVGTKQGGPRVKAKKQAGGGTLQEVQRIAQRYNMNNSGFSPAQVNEFAMNRELEPFGYSAKRAKPDAYGRQGGVYILNPKGRFYNPFKAKFQRINLGAGNLGTENVENIPGYARMLDIVNGIITKSLARGRTQDEIEANVMAYVTGPRNAVFTRANDVQRNQLIRNVKTEFGKRLKPAPSVGRLFGTIRDITKITMSEKELLKKQIRDLARGARDSKIAFMKAEAELAKQVKELVLAGQIKTKQVASIIRRFAAVNVFNEDSVDKFVEYMTKVFEDANYDQKIQNARKKLKTAKKNIRSKIGIAEAAGPALIQLFSINPNLIPDSVLDKYIALVDSFGASDAVLKLADVNDVISDANEILKAIDEEVSLAEELAIRFDNFLDKELDENGKIDFAQTLIKMLEAKEITEEDIKLMKKYKNLIIPKVEKSPKTEAEIEAEKKKLINAIKGLDIDIESLPTRYERNLARELKELLVSELLNQLSVSQLENVVKLIDNINNGYLPHYAELTVERLDGIKDSDTLIPSIKTGVALKIEKAYARLKKTIIRSQKSATSEMIRRGPLYNIEQLFGDFKTKNIFDALFSKAAKGQASFDTAMNTINKTLDSAREKVASSYKNDSNATLFSSFKMMTYMLQLEFQNNLGSSQVQNVVKVINATIKHIDEGNTRFGEREVEMLQEILDKYSKVVGKDKAGKDIVEIDSEKLYKSFNSAEQEAIKTIQDLNESLREKAVYTAAVIRGDRINPLNNYVHHYVMHEYNADENATGTQTSEAYNNSMRPSTRAKSLEERTKAISPLNFDVFAATQRGAKFVMLDFHLTKAIRTARKALAETKAKLEKNGRIPKEEREIFNALNSAFDEVVKNVLTNNFITNSIGDEIVDFVSKSGYRAILASVPRFISEYVSNLGTIIFDPASFAEGVSIYKTINGVEAQQIMDNSDSVQTNRLYSSQSLSGKFIDSSILSQTTGIVSGSAKGDVVNVVNKIYNNTLKKYKNFVELTADTLISTPDKLVMRPYWFGVYSNVFQRETGEKIDLQKIAANDEAYMTQYKDAIKKATAAADRMSVRVGATDNPFMGILKGSVKPDQSALTRGFNNFNNFMTRFAIYEYTTAREGIYAAMGQGLITRKQGVALLAGVTTRMTVYTLLTNILSSTLLGFFADEDEEEDEKTFMQKFGQSVASTATGLVLGRNFGNATKGLINYGVEEGNEKFFTALREGEYDPYKDAISFSFIPRAKEGQQTNLTDFITNMGGSFGPAMKTADLALRKAFGPEKKEKEAIERSNKENLFRIPLEVLGNMGMIPLYKDVRKVVMLKLYGDLDNASAETADEKARAKKKLHGYKNKTQLKRYAPELYEIEFGKKSPDYESEQAKKKIEREKAALQRKIDDDYYNYVPKQQQQKEKEFGSGNTFGSKPIGE